MEIFLDDLTTLVASREQVIVRLFQVFTSEK